MLKKMFSYVPFMLAFTATLFSQEPSLELAIGSRQDHLSWSLGGPGGIPRTLSRLVWHDVQSVELQAKVETTFCSDYYVRLEGDYGWIYHGWNTDADYLPDDETLVDTLFLKSKADSSKGAVWDLSIAVSSYSRQFGDCFSFRPLLGYSVNSQRLKLEDGVILVDLFEPDAVGSRFPNLDSSYTTYWSGPWVGFDLAYNGISCWTFSTTQEFHALYYDAKGNWNLRDDILGDFHHYGWGWGYFTKFNAQYDLGCGWDFGAQLKYNYCRMNDGRDHSTILNDDPNIPVYQYKVYTKIKHASWHSISCLLTLGYGF